MIQEVTENKEQYSDLLLLADEQQSMIDRYIGRGRMFVLKEGDTVYAECVVTDEGNGVAEIKNMAVAPKFQRMGYGRRLIEQVKQLYCGSHKILRVGTGDSPLTIPFYQSCGFRPAYVVKNFFTDNYDAPIFENGRQLVDMVYLEMEL